MRVKQTAKKILSDEIEKSTLIIKEKSEHNSDDEVEFVVECRRDQEGNQFLLDGTLVIEPAAVESSSKSKDTLRTSKELNFTDFVKEIQTLKPEVVSSVILKKNPPSFTANLNTINFVKCTACNTKFNPFLGQTMHPHPLMKVILCKDCILNQKEEFFVIDSDDNKETLCRWCVEGGSLICCDICPKSFCKSCIKRNLGRTMLSEILNQDDTIQWECFVCNPKPIESLKNEYKKISNDIRLFSNKHKFQKIAKKPARLSEIVNKKRPLAKAFPNEITNSPNVIVSLQQPIAKKMSNTGIILGNMACFGTEWYMRNVKLRNIFEEIDEIDSRTLLNAINSTKKCIEAFYSDIRNLEVEISKASTASDIPAVVSMFKSVYRHHIFNRFCQVKARISEDKNLKFVPQTANGQVECNNSGIKNTNSIPSLSINNIISTAPNINNPLTAKEIVNPLKPLSNGDHATNAMTSIDLTDDNDNKSDSVHSTSVHYHLIPDNKMDDDHLAQTSKFKSKEVVDLCADEETTVPTYPIVNLNINNELHSNGVNQN